MASSFTFDLTPPRRPSLADLGGAAKQDDAAFPPNPLTMPTAENWNHFARALEAWGKVVPFLVVTIHILAGTPTLVSVESVRSTFTLTYLQGIVGLLVDNGAGDTTFDYTSIAGQFVPPTRPPHVDVIDATGARYPGVSQPTATSVRIVTQNAGGVATDYSFVLTLW
jgi:sugar/nucleoside kinase (ribokinase family)